MDYTYLSLFTTALFFALYYLFLFFNTHHLKVESVEAIVENKTHTDAHQYSSTVYNTYYAGNTTYTMPSLQVGLVPEMYVLEVHIEGKKVGIQVKKEIFDLVSVGDMMAVVYSRRRFSRTIQIVSATRK